MKCDRCGRKLTLFTEVLPRKIDTNTSYFMYCHSCGTKKYSDIMFYLHCCGYTRFIYGDTYVLREDCPR